MQAVNSGTQSVAVVQGGSVAVIRKDAAVSAPRDYSDAVVHKDTA